MDKKEFCTRYVAAGQDTQTLIKKLLSMDLEKQKQVLTEWEARGKSPEVLRQILRGCVV